MRFDINLATKRHINHRLLKRLAGGSLLFLSALFAFQTFHICSNLGELNRLNGENLAFQNRLNNRPANVSEQEFARMQAEVKFFNGILERKAAGWLETLDKLEKATPVDIAITSFSPDSKTGEIAIEGQARNFTGVCAYLEKLEASGYFTQIQLQSHKDISDSGKTKGIQFQITFRIAAP